MRARLIPFDPSILKGLRDHVHATLRAAIISGELPTGAHLNERQLASELGISTTPVKEALRRLEGEGLIVTEPRRAVRVSFDARQAEEMALARAALESMIARMAASRIDTARLKALEQTFAKMAAVTQTGGAQELIALNEEFHEAIHEASGCAYLQRVLVGQRVYDHATRAFLLGEPEERERALSEHRAILDALARRDSDAAERAMRDHVIRSGRQHVKAAFERRSASSTESAESLKEEVA